MSLKYKSKFDFISKVVDHYDNLKYALLEAQAFDPKTYGFPNFYYKVMETDQLRVDAFRNAFKKYRGLKNKIVCEIGVGTLALTKHYLDDVKKAYLIESNPNVIPVVKQILKKNGWDKKVELIHGDALTLELPEKVDFIIGELMSIFCANELQVQIFRHMRQFLKPNGKLLPEKIINLAQLCYVEFDQEHTHYPIFFTRHLPELYTPQKVINKIDLYTEKKINIQRKTKFMPLLSGTVNAIYLNSWIQVAEGANFTGTDSLMPPTVVKLKKSVKVKAGETVVLHSDYTYGTSLNEAKFWVDR
ncbi:MAG: putative RNA methylase [Saprospiraceae bacterium]|jgi:predicted RNA methylase